MAGPAVGLPVVVAGARPPSRLPVEDVAGVALPRTGRLPVLEAGSALTTAPVVFVTPVPTCPTRLPTPAVTPLTVCVNVVPPGVVLPVMALPEVVSAPCT